MNITNEFKEAVSAKDVQLVRIMMKDSMILDPTFEEFDDMASYASDKLPGLFDAHDGKEFDNDQAAWNKDMLNEEMVDLLFNFSKERVNHLREVCKVLYAEKYAKLMDMKKSSQSHASSSTYEPFGSLATSSSGAVSRKQIGTGVAVAGGVIAVTGLVASQTAVAIAGAVVAVVGGAMILSDN